MGNKRVFYACQGVCFNNEPVEGVQSITLDTQQDIIDVDNWGSLDIDYVPNYPAVTVNMTRVMSTGQKLLYSGTLLDNINTHSHNLCLFIGKDTKGSLAKTTGEDDDVYNIHLSGVSINSVEYNFAVDGNFTETLNFICYDKSFNTCPVEATVFSNLRTSTNVARRQSFSTDIIAPGLLPNGLRISNVSISASFGITDIKEFGMNVSNPVGLYRYATLPIVSNCSVECIADGSGLDFYDFNTSGIDHFCEFTGLNKSLVPLSFNLCPGLVDIDLGTGILESVNYGGGDTGGGNVAVSLDFSSKNNFTVTRSE